MHKIMCRMHQTKIGFMVFSLGLLSLSYFYGCSKENNIEDDKIIATVDDQNILLDEFVKRLELTPLPGTNKLKRKQKALDIWIDEYLVSQWTQQNQIDKDPGFNETLELITKRILIRELFYHEVRALIKPDSLELHEAFIHSLFRNDVVGLYTEDQFIVDEWKELIDSKYSFSDILQKWGNDSRVRIDSASFHWGDGAVPELIEKVAYSIEPGEHSDIINLPQGYGLIFVKNRIQDQFLSRDQIPLKQQTVATVFKARMETIHANEYVINLMAGKQVTTKAEGFRELISVLQPYVNGGSINELLISVSPAASLSLDTEIDRLDIPVVVTPDFTWSIRETIKILYQYNFPFQESDELRIMKNLVVLLKNAVRDEYLYRKAMELGLNESLPAKKDYGLWRRYLLYRKGISTYLADVDPVDRQEAVTTWLNRLRKKAKIRVDDPMLNAVNYTGIQMLAFWKDDTSPQLAVPPLIDFRNNE